MAQDNTSDRSSIIPARIMVSAVSILVVVIILIVCLHVYARCCLLGSHRPPAPQPRRARRARLQTRLRVRVVVTSDNVSNVVQTAPVQAHSRGLDEAARRSLPMFVFSSESGFGGEKGMVCAVCLSEFEENEKGRLLPNCNHCFHIDCIDMWFVSNSTCPLCRAPVFEHNAVEATATSQIELAEAAPVNESDNRELSHTTLIENETDSPSSSSTSISSTGGGFLQLKRILIREGILSSPRGLGRGSAVCDIERGSSPKAST